MRWLRWHKDASRWKGNDLYIRCPVCDELCFSGISGRDGYISLTSCQLTFKECGHTVRGSLGVHDGIVWVEWDVAG